MTPDKRSLPFNIRDFKMREMHPEDYNNSHYLSASKLICRECRLNHLSVTKSDRASIVAKKDASGDQQYYKKRLVELQEQL